MKKVKKLTIILIIILLSLVSFVGIYVQKQNVMKNIVKGYNFGMNIEGYREVRIKVADKQEVTNDKVEQVKGLLEKRLEKLGARDYLIKVDYTTGEIVLELEETRTTDKIVADIYGAGELKMVDSKDTSKVFMTNDDVEEVSLIYNTLESGTTVYLDFKFTEEGAKKIEDLSSNAYKTIEKEETEDEEAESEEDTQPKLALLIDETELTSSSFDDPITEGRLQLSLNQATTNTEEIQSAIDTGLAISTIINNGPLPIKYELSSNTYIYSEITQEVKIAFILVIAILVLIAFGILIVKHKLSAVLALVSYIGFVATYLLTLRYTNVTITLEGIVGILITLIINYLTIQKFLTNQSILKAFKEMAIQLIPVIAVIIAFSFIGWTNIASFGMTMFWGLLLTVIYHFIVTKALLEK